jgi:mannose-6-phosphate isomerase-like protein (cupin superfamily)
MPLNLPHVTHARTNALFKSSGEDNITLHVDGQMTETKMIFHARGSRTNGAVGVMEIFWQPGDAALHHLHRLEDEGFYVIDGQVTIHTPFGEHVLA